MQNEITIVMADDHPIFRKGLRQIIEMEQGLKVLGEASDGRAALVMIQEMKPEVAVLDVNMPQMKGFDVAREIQRLELPVGIIFLTMYDDERMFNEALNVGAKGYLLKDSAIIDIVTSIRSVAAGQRYISPAISNYLMNRAARGAALDKLFTNAGVTPTGDDRAAAINEFGLASTSSDLGARGRALRRVGENSLLVRQEFNRAFVLMEYFGYLRRNPFDPPESTLDYTGYNFWLDKLNTFDGNFQNAEMVKAFLGSIEYRKRFNP